MMTEQERQRLASAEMCIAEISLVVKDVPDKNTLAALKALLLEHAERRIEQQNSTRRGSNNANGFPK